MSRMPMHIGLFLALSGPASAGKPLDVSLVQQITDGVQDKAQILSWFGEPGSKVPQPAAPSNRPSGCVAVEQWFYASGRKAGFGKVNLDTMWVAFDNKGMVCGHFFVDSGAKWDSTHVEDVRTGKQDKKQILAWFGDPRSRTPLDRAKSRCVERWSWNFVVTGLHGYSNALNVGFDGADKVCSVDYNIGGVATGDLKARSAVPEMLENAMSVSTAQPSPKWRAEISAPAVEFLVPSEDGILVGTLGLSQDNLERFAQPTAAALVYLDARTGQQRWTAPRKAVVGAEYSVLATYPIVLVRREEPTGTVSYEALDPATGARRWGIDTGSAHDWLITTRRDLLIVAERAKDGGTELRAFQLASGTPVWHQIVGRPATVSSDGKDTPNSTAAPTLLAGEGTILVIGSDIAALDVASGARRWTYDLAEGPDPRPNVLLGGDALLASTGQGIVKLGMSDGRAKWVTHRDGATGVTALSGNELLEVRIKPQATDSAAFTLGALDNKSGKERWSANLPGPILSGLMVDHGIVYLATADELLGFDVASGVLRHAHKFELAAEPGKSFDSLLIRNGRLIVSRQHGIAALDLDSGKWIYGVAHAPSFSGATIGDAPWRSTVQVGGVTAVTLPHFLDGSALEIRCF
jgi:outer membrane protein assembly factor BamB